MVSIWNYGISIYPILDETFSELKEISHKVGLAALELGGTCTGEHGVGLGKQQLMALERGDVAVDLMKTIKKSIDEKNLMNPGKVIPF
jgi:D-lactate dehydrogenase (cytochrome)